MNFGFEVELHDTETGRRLHAIVKVVGVGNNVATEIRCDPSPTQDEERAIELAAEEMIRRELGYPATMNVSDERFADEASLQAAMRRHLGGGQG
jgi:hypothetical protein